MAVKLADFKRKLRCLGDDMGFLDMELQALLDTAEAVVEQYSPNAPEAVRDRAVILVASYLNDQPSPGDPGGPASSYRSHSNAFAFSGAKALLAPWRARRGLLCG